MTQEFPKNFNPIESEAKWYELWQKNKIYQASELSSKPSYSVLMPPPNVTGILHFGHVLNNTIPDIYCRRKRMDGYEVCWFPGLDHAGIATQSRVEKELKQTENLTRYDLGREKFVEKVWEWKHTYGGIIFKQLQRLGVSTDWSKTLFTMDEKASNAVRDVFIELFDMGLIYKGKRIINWSPLARTALSDEEVEFREVKEHFYTLRYKLENSDDYLKVSTVRPETIYGDVAIAVNPNDERYKNLIGTKVTIPLVGKLIPIIADDYADPTFGTGCVKITPAHDPNDFEVGLRHNLEQINTINPDGTLNELTGEFAGMDRFAARKSFVEKLKALDLIEKIEDYTHNVGFSQRGGEPIEPYLSDQWFVKMKPLAEIALEDVLNGNIKFHPNHWVKTYQHWMENVRDWCISRQLWWGHRIPVYYAEDGRFTAASSYEQAIQKLGLENGATLTQDEDVLDTWFSSWLWPLTTMQWDSENPEQNNELMNKFLPTDLLVTGPDIIFFWVARMVMATKKFKGEIAFKNVYYTSMIRDGQGRKLSKSLGNSPDPLNIMDKYGADAVRFTMIYLSPLGQDVRMDVDVKAQDISSMEIGRNFVNKIWNAGRFLLMKKEQTQSTDSNALLDDNQLSLADNWIRSKFASSIQKIDASLDEFNVTEYAKILYNFIWRDFCDWYVEIIKIQMQNSNDAEYQARLINSTIDLYEQILRLLHPVMPFVTEEIWHIITQKDENESISLQANPKANFDKINNELELEFEFLQATIEEIRKLRANSNVAVSQKVPLQISCQSDKKLEFMQSQSNLIATMTKASEISLGIKMEKPENSSAAVFKDLELYIILEGLIDKEKESERLNKEIERLENLIAGINQKLSNEAFVAKAPAKVIDMERKKLDDMSNSISLLKENLISLQK